MIFFICTPDVEKPILNSALGKEENESGNIDIPDENNESEGEESTLRKVILKLDDLYVKDGKCACLPTMSWLFDNGIHASFGIISKRCDNTFYNTLSKYISNYKESSDPIIEFWHHGYDHINPEFKGTSYDYQLEHFNMGDSRVYGLTGIQMKTFGPPLNQVDENTVKVISSNANYKYIFFVSESLFDKTDLIILNNRVNMENGTGNVNYDFFKKNYIEVKDKYKDYIVLQGHPNNWDTKKLEEFKNIVSLLKEDGCEFVLPSKCTTK